MLALSSKNSHCNPLSSHTKETTHSHASHCHHYHYYHYCTVDFVLFHNITRCTNSLFSRIHASTTDHNIKLHFGWQRRDMREVRL